MHEIQGNTAPSSSMIRTIPTGGTVPANYFHGSQNSPIIIELKCPNCGNYEQEKVS